MAEKLIPFKDVIKSLMLIGDSFFTMADRAEQAVNFLMQSILMGYHLAVVCR
ncbi:MAG: hypothetical protein ABI863_22430 [Ginsengibacter sp.]